MLYLVLFLTPHLHATCIQYCKVFLITCLFGVNYIPTHDITGVVGRDKMFMETILPTIIIKQTIVFLILRKNCNYYFINFQLVFFFGKNIVGTPTRNGFFQHKSFYFRQNKRLGDKNNFAPSRFICSFRLPSYIIFVDILTRTKSTP